MASVDRYQIACNAFRHREESALTVKCSDEQSPSKIEHLVDTDLDPKTGEYSYFYNYLLYTFDYASTQITARSYLDDVSEVSILQCPTGIDIERELDGILVYLRLRYPSVRRLGPSGYAKI